MLSSLATYLFGGSDSGSPPTEEQLRETQVKGQDGDEWILIDTKKEHSESEEDMSLGSCSDNENAAKMATRGKKLRKKLAKPAPRKVVCPVKAEELPVVEVSEPSLPGPRSYAQTAALARPDAEAEVPKAKETAIVPVPAKVPILVVKAADSPKKSNKKIPKTMEDSWFVTPPPCFTRPNTFMMESSPLEDILIEHPSMSVFSPRPSSTIDSESPMTMSPNSSGYSSPAIPSSPPVAESPAPPKVVKASVKTGPPMPVTPEAGSVTLASDKGQQVPRKELRPQLYRDPMQEMTNNCLIRLVPRKARKQRRREAKETVKTVLAAELRKVQNAASADSSARAEAQLRSLAFEPVVQERTKQLRSQKYLKKSFMERMNATHVQAKRPLGRQGKMAAVSGLSCNRKTNKSC
ncbi:Tumor protein p53-inducible nuclear protein 1 [Halotydeus destructor]|nr:Tumor protein p53-inducible nuclear protein 1 [Halotydeus destructor]